MHLTLANSRFLLVQYTSKEDCCFAGAGSCPVITYRGSSVVEHCKQLKPGALGLVPATTVSLSSVLPHNMKLNYFQLRLDV